jgi:hypothetical protein
MKRQEMKSATTKKGCLHPHIKMFNKKDIFMDTDF